MTDHWLLAVPDALRRSERDLVNYLGMVVAIDFRHWAEEGGGLAPGAAGDTPHAIGFYTVVEGTRDASATGGGSGGTTAAAAQAAAVQRAMHPEAPGSGAAAPVMLRGSAAMIHLLRTAVEEHGVRWHCPAYLAQLAATCGDVTSADGLAAAREALRVCFAGCREDGATPLWMPATEERISLLFSVAEALEQRQTSFYQLLCESNGRLFNHAEGSGFVNALVGLHPRYHDVAPHPTRVGESSLILKLSQLTALSCQNALPALWCWQHSNGSPQEDAADWLGELRRKAAVPTDPVNLFTDIDELSICCDYQIPKALRDAGALVYSDHLAGLIDSGVVLAPSAPEEVSLRFATLVATEGLLAYLTARLAPEVGGRPIPVAALDYALWYAGRHPLPAQASTRHHLCRTVMY